MRSNYHNLRIFYKLLLNYLALLVIVCFISFLSLQITLKIYDEQLYLKSSQVLSFFMTSMENEFKNIEKFSLNIAEDSTIQDQLDEITYMLADNDRLSELTLLKDKLLLHSLSERSLSSLTYVDTTGKEYTVGKSPPEIEESRKKKVIAEAKEMKGANIFYQPDLEFKFLISARQILQYKNLTLKPLGTLYFTYNIEELVNQNFTVLQNDKTQLDIFFDGEPIYINNAEFAANWLGRAEQNKQGYFLQKMSGKKYFISYITSDYMKWTYVSILPYNTIYQNNITLRSVLILVFVVLFLTTIYVSYRIARNITKPIENLTLTMQGLEHDGNIGNLQEKLIYSEWKDEVGFLQKEFSSMIARINDLIKENYEKQLLIKDTEYKALLAQINPHFLYNTLNSLYWLAKTGENENVSRMIMALGELLRAAINANPVICIDEEVELVQSYVNIQKMRYSGRAEFLIDISDSHRQYLIPRMTLQPLVENAINYGVENMLGVCTVSIRSMDRDSDLELTVEDNGPGVEPELLEKLKRFEIHSKSTGIGLKNINDRLKFLYGDAYGIKIESEAGKGTKIIIRIPKR
jgi:two-component system sensor histidine kinase YesM